MPTAVTDPTDSTGFQRLDAAERRAVKVLLESGLFDHQYFGAQVGRRFRSAKEGAVEFVRTGATGVHSPHPLVSIAHTPMAVRTAWRQAGADAMVRELLSDAGCSRDWSLVFDPRAVLKDAGEAPGAVQDFLRSLGPESVLPVSHRLAGAAVTFGAVRDTLIDSADTVRRQHGEAHRIAHKTWSPAEEAAFVADVARAVPPTPPLVSVVLTVDDDVDLLQRTAEGVMNQSYRKWEVLFVGTNLSEDVRGVIDDLVSADSRFRQASGDGQDTAGDDTEALAAARGELVAFLENGDRWRRHYLRTMVGFMHREGALAAFAGGVYRDPRQDKLVACGQRWNRTSLLAGHTPASLFVVDADLAREVGGIDPSLGGFPRHDLALRTARVESPDFVPFTGADLGNREHGDPVERGAASQHWYWVTVARALIDWDAAARGARERVRGRVSVVIPIYDEMQMTAQCVQSIVSGAADRDIEVVMVDNGSRPPVSLALASVAAVHENVRYLRLPVNFNFAIGCNYGLVHSTGEYVFFLNNDTALRGGWIDPLMRRLDDLQVRGVQPLLVYPDDTIQAAGSAFLADSTMPIHPLAGHPREDAQVAAKHQFSAVTAAALMMRADEAIELEGFDPVFVNGSEDVDLCLRAVQRFGGGFAVEPGVVIEHKESKTPGRGKRIGENRRLFMERWRGRLPAPDYGLYDALGLEVPHLATEGSRYSNPRPVVVRPRREALCVDGVTRPVLRWGIKNPAPPGVEGDTWGDTHFIEDLGHALEAMGQEVVTYRRTAQTVPASSLDDVVLGVHGYFPVLPHPGKVNVLWIISHPDRVQVDELHGFDLVYAASPTWAARMTARSGVPVRTLLQATNPREFGVGASLADPAENADVVFVGQTRPNGPRQVVVDAIEAGVQVKVWGPKWDRYIPSHYIAGDYFPNHELKYLYQSSRVVLADHHPDMAREGFMANRLFDAVAAGARVVCDPVAGVAETFHGAVRTYSSVDDLARLVSAEGVSREFPHAEERLAIASATTENHSFGARVDRLMNDVQAVLRGREI